MLCVKFGNVYFSNFFEFFEKGVRIHFAKNVAAACEKKIDSAVIELKNARDFFGKSY